MLRPLLFRLSELTLHSFHKLVDFTFQAAELLAEFSELTRGAVDFLSDGTPFFVQLFIFFLLLREGILEGLGVRLQQIGGRW
jgi:hypothetical protein